MTILLAYFVWVVGMLAVIATAWIGVANSGLARLHLHRASTTMQQSYDASFMAEASGNTPPRATAAAKAQAHATGRHAARRLPARQRPSLDRRVALRASPPPFDGH